MAVLYGPVQCTENCVSFDDRNGVADPGRIYSSPIGQSEILHGDESGIIQRIKDGCDKVGPDFVAVIGMSISSFMGCDLKRISSVSESYSGVKCIAIDTNGFDPYYDGITKTVLAMAKRFGENSKEKAGSSLNVLGYSWFDFPNESDKRSLTDCLIDSGYETVRFFPGERIDDYRSIGDACISNAVSVSGVDIAAGLNRMFGTDYYVGLPDILLDDIPSGSRVIIVGDRIQAASMARVVEKKKCSCTIASFFNHHSSRDKDETVDLKDETELERCLEQGGFDYLIGDPLLKNLKCDIPQLIPLPHPAISGRLFLKDSVPLLSGHHRR